VTRIARTALVLGAILGLLGALLAGEAAVATWRALALPVALGAVVAGIAELSDLARREWRRDRPAARRYLQVGALFFAAFVLTVAATG